MVRQQHIREDRADHRDAKRTKTGRGHKVTFLERSKSEASPPAILQPMQTEQAKRYQTTLDKNFQICIVRRMAFSPRARVNFGVGLRIFDEFRVSHTEDRAIAKSLCGRFDDCPTDV